MTGGATGQRSRAARRQKPLLLRRLAGFFERLAASSGSKCEMADGIHCPDVPLARIEALDHEEALAFL